MTDAANVLQDALNILGENGEGWVQQLNYEKDDFGNRTKHCLFGAIAEVEGVVQDFAPMNSPISDMLDRFSVQGQEACDALVYELIDQIGATVFDNGAYIEGPSDVQEWQDDPLAEWDDVRSLLKNAIDRLKRNREGGE